MTETVSQPREIDVRAIPKPQRHPLIFDAMEPLEVGQSVVVKNDHNPIPLRGQVEAIYGEQFAWNYLEEGPDVFRLQLTRRAPAPENWRRPESKKNTLPMASSESGEANASTREAKAPVEVNLLEACRAMPHSGPQWAHESEDLDVTLLSWEREKRIEAHVNNEVDVVLIGVAGEGRIWVEGEAREMRPGVALLVPKGCARGVESTSERFSYLSVHRRRRGLMPANNLRHW